MWAKIKRLWAWYVKAVAEPAAVEYGTPEEVAAQHREPNPWP